MAYFFDGFANASSVFAGNGVGEKSKEKIDWIIKKCFYVCAVNSIVLFIMFTVFKAKIIGVYTTNSEIISTANQYGIWLMIFPLVVNAGLIFYGIFTGVTYTSPIRNSMLISLGLFLAVYFFIVPLWGNHGLWVSFILNSRKIIHMKHINVLKFKSFKDFCKNKICIIKHIIDF